ncbi:TPA: DUF2851 family protein [Candidatus Poribacteria bacterium]|nr:DUF2851 family protein [Candidatus Poribacteria bacterium]
MPDAKFVDENLVHHIWDDQHFSNANLRATDGREIQILKTGFWNGDAGPDFVQAEVIIDGKLYLGDVEVHVKSSEWQVHGHHADSKYNNVIIHVVLWDDAINLRTEKQNGEKIPTLALSEWLDETIGKLLDDFHQKPMENLTNIAQKDCRANSVQLNLDKLTEVLESLGQERFIEKTENVQKRFKDSDLEQVLYEGVMEALGYSKNREPFLQLAKKAPFTQLAGKHIEEIQAILFGVAGLLPKVDIEADANPIDDDASEYIARLRDLWSTADESYKSQQMQAEQWKFFRLRPGNFPTRRIAGISHILTNCKDGSLMLRFLPLIEEAVAHKKRPTASLRLPSNEVKGSSAGLERSEGIKQIYKKLWGVMMPKASGYWAEHSTFSGKAHKRTVYLIGKERAADVLVNIVLPVAYLWAERAQSRQLTEAVQLLYDKHPKLQDNVITNQVIQQLFPEKRMARSVINTAKRQQGLIYLYKMFCSSRICDMCPIIGDTQYCTVK